MSAESPQSDAGSPEGGKPSLRARLTALGPKIVHWAGASRRNSIIAGGIGFVLLASILASWSLLARMAVEPVNTASVEGALEALDAGHYDEAKHIIGQLQDLGDVDKFGAALFVMGAAKAKEADDEFSPERRRAMHAVAARYLQKARALGVPPDREARSQFLLGRSLIMGNQSAAGVALLEQSLRAPNMPRSEIHSLLATAYLDDANPKLDQALSHLQQRLKDAQLEPAARDDTLLQLADILLRLNQPEPAQHALSALADKSTRPETILLEGRLRLGSAEAKPAGDPERAALLNQADKSFREAMKLDKSSGHILRQAMYWLGKCYIARGEPDEALKHFERMGKLYSDTPDGMAAVLAAAELQRQQGEFDKALASYRLLLELTPPQAAYVNHLLPLAELRKRLLLAQQQFVEGGKYEEAVDILDLFRDLFKEAEIVEMRAKSHAKWGESLLGPHNPKDRWRSEKDYRTGRSHLRIAGRAFEDLARLRFAKSEFTEDLWQAGENYFRGQSYASAARVIDEYLRHEARSRNALALLRLGQSSIAVGDYQGAVRALNECAEIYPRSDAVFQARLEAARAYRELGNFPRAEQLLWRNLTGDDLLTTAPEWRDSIFEIGRLYYQIGRYDDAIRELEEAVLRYPDDSDALLANYTIARACHRAAEAPGQRMREAKTENERQKNRVAMNEYLERALTTYLDVQRAITLAGGSDHDPMLRTLLRNCYMMRGAVLFDLRRFDEAREAYSGLSSLYQNDPFVLEIQVQIASCLRRLNEPLKARLAIVQAQQLLAALPTNADFLASTNFNRQQWELLLNQMASW